MNEKKKSIYGQGVKVFIGLMLLTIVEYYIAQLPGGAITLLFIVALIKAGMIIHYFMHVSSLWSEEGEH